MRVDQMIILALRGDLLCLYQACLVGDTVVFDADRLRCFVESMLKRLIFISCFTLPYQWTFFKLLQMCALTDSVRLISLQSLHICLCKHHSFQMFNESSLRRLSTLCLVQQENPVNGLRTVYV